MCCFFSVDFSVAFGLGWVSKINDEITLIFLSARTKSNWILYKVEWILLSFANKRFSTYWTILDHANNNFFVFDYYVFFSIFRVFGPRLFSHHQMNGIKWCFYICHLKKMAPVLEKKKNITQMKFRIRWISWRSAII